MARLQPVSAKLGEIKFRKKLIEQHLGKGKLIPEEPNQEEILNILTQRVETTRKILKKLKNEGFLLSPFLEIGAEKCQRSMVLVNEFEASGFASDISFESLAAAPEFAKALGFKKLPTLVCCNAYNLPFQDSSFPFVFCFETLHHFPDPLPILKEIKRVLAPGGFLYFDEEPIKQLANLRIWRRPTKLRGWEKILKYVGILPFVSTIGKTETNHGVIEAEFDLKTWQKSLDIFEKVEATIQPVFFGPKATMVKRGSQGWLNPPLLTRVLLGLQGGGIKALCQKERGLKISNQSIFQVLICPDCGGKIEKAGKFFKCLRCKRKYPIKNEVLFLLPKALMKMLYFAP